MAKTPAKHAKVSYTTEQPEVITTTTSVPNMRPPEDPPVHRSPGGSPPQRATVASPPAALTEPKFREIVIAGFENVAAKGQPRDIHEFSRVIAVPAIPNTRTYDDGQRIYEFTGLDDQGRKIFRDHTRM